MCRLLHRSGSIITGCIGGKEEIDLRYDSDLNHQFGRPVEKNRQKERLLQYTGTGIHG
jgi:hypothetical protein